MRLKLYKGNVTVIGRASPNSLYSDALVTFEDDRGAYDQRDAAGFIRLNALRLRTLAMRERLRSNARAASRLHPPERAAAKDSGHARSREDMTTLAVTVFILVYLGMALGRVPGLAVDRTGVALLGLIVLLASGDLTLEEAGAAVDMPTIALLFALMILSAQFEHSGFYGWVADRIVHAARNPKIAARPC